LNILLIFEIGICWKTTPDIITNNWKTLSGRICAKDVNNGGAN
jgi:hypothetical protein